RADGTVTVTVQFNEEVGIRAGPVTRALTGADPMSTVTISAHDGDGDNVINHAEAQGGVTLSGTVTGLAAGATFLITVTDGEFSKIGRASCRERGEGWGGTVAVEAATAGGGVDRADA